ncbi:sensor histidine kinase [Paenibacillus sp. HB172176]|uniref:cache domain-containing sensor histidine kinase n=1 Tax=Paenibacillus sp. HB172176 TaxID=2493690 RepID=UPI001438FB3D|nr:sensor histidine kinase [Paenibacillus sp. HB172176]
MFRVLHSMKIFHKLVLLMLLLTSIVCTGFLVAATISFNTFDTMLHEHASRSMNLSVAGIENEIANIEKLSMNMALDSRIQEQMISIRGELSSYERVRKMADFQRQVLQYMFAEKSISSFRFLNEEGYEFYVGQNQVTNDEDELAGIIDKARAEEGGEVWVELSGESPGLVLAREIRSIFKPTLETLGTLIFRIDFRNLVEQHFGTTGDADVKLFMLSQSGTVYYRPADATFDGFDASGLAFEGDNGFLLQKMGGSSYFLSYTKSDASGWLYISLIPYDEIFKQKSELRNTIFLLVGGLIVIALLISFLFARGFTRPISLLTGQMRNAEKGDFDASLLDIREASRMDEIGYLHKRFNSMIRNIQQLIDENYKKQIVIKDTEYRALQAQINPHFLYNTLNSINWMARRRNDDVISTMVESLSGILRLTIDDKRAMITVREEIELIQGYMYIQKVRYGKRIDFSIEVPDSVKECPIPKFTLQPIVENAIYHAVDQMADVCHIVLTAEPNGELNAVVFTIRDDVPGLDADKLELLRSFRLEARGTGIGLKNIQERLVLIFGDGYGIKVDSSPGEGLIVNVIIPASS